jgi:hypothetical protein
METTGLAHFVAAPPEEGMETTNPAHFVAAPPEEGDDSEIQADSPRLEQPGKPSIQLLLWFVVYCYVAVVVMRTSFDPDIWWHLRTGQWIAEHGILPSTDPFSSFGQGKSWVAYSWLFELLIYALHRGFGLAGIVFYRVAMAFTVSVAIHRFVAKREPQFLPVAGLVSLALVSLTELMNERPWLLTILFYTLSLDLVLDLRAGRSRRDIWLLPALFTLWANTHIQFVYGLFLLVLACVAPLVDLLPWFTEDRGHSARAGSREWWRLGAVTLACTLATLLNPYHFHIYGVVIDHAQSAGLNDVIIELLPLSFRNAADWSLLVLVLLATFHLGRRRQFSSFEAGLLVASAYFSFHSRRDGWFMMLTALAILTNNEREASSRIPARCRLTRTHILSLGSCVGVVLVVLGWWCNVTKRGLDQSEAFDYPAGAVHFVESKGYGGPLYNPFGWGGYLIWRLPRLLVSLDGRANLHGGSRVIRSIQTWAGQPDWNSDPELKSARLVIGPSQLPLMSLLRTDPRFELVYEDRHTMVYTSQSNH